MAINEDAVTSATDCLEEFFQQDHLAPTREEALREASRLVSRLYVETDAGNRSYYSSLMAIGAELNRRLRGLDPGLESRTN